MKTAGQAAPRLDERTKIEYNIGMMKKRTKIIIGIAVFIVTMGLIVTAVVLAVLSGKKNAELYTAEYTYVSDAMVDGAYVAVLDGHYVLAREGGTLSDRYAYIELVFDDENKFSHIFYRDTRGGRGFLNTDGKVLGKVKAGDVCLYAKSDYAVLLDGDTIRAGAFAYTPTDGETAVEDYALYAALLPDMCAVRSADGIAIRWQGGGATFDTVAPTGVPGLLLTDDGVYSLKRRQIVELADRYTVEAVPMGEPALTVRRSDGITLYNGAGVAVATGLKDENLVEMTHVEKREDATFHVTYVFLRENEQSYKRLRDGALSDVGCVFETPNGLCCIRDKTVYSLDGKKLREYDTYVEPVYDAYAVRYDKDGKHYIAPLDGKPFECAALSGAAVDANGDVVYLSREADQVTAFDANGKQTDTRSITDGQSVTVVGGKLIARDRDGAWLKDTRIDTITQDGRFAFRTEPNKLTVIKSDTMAEYYFYTAGTPELDVTPFGTVVSDSVSGLHGFVSADGKFTVRPSYRKLEAYNGYLMVSVDGETWSMTDYKGKILYSGIDDYADLGICVYILTTSGEGMLLDAHGRDMLKKTVTAAPQHIEQWAVVAGQAVRAYDETQSYYKFVAGNMRVLRTLE